MTQYILKYRETVPHLKVLCYINKDRNKNLINCGIYIFDKQVSGLFSDDGRPSIRYNSNLDFLFVWTKIYN